MGVRVRDGEKTSQWEPTETAIDLGVLGLTGIVEEYDELEARIKRDVARRDEIKDAMKALGKNRELKVNGQVRFELRNDGQFMPAQFKKTYPGYFEDFTVMVPTPTFDLEKFKKEMPSLYEAYRAPKIIRVKNS
jgi:hypothetical protein